MDLLSMLQNAVVIDLNGDELGNVVGVNITGGKLVLEINVEGEEENGDGGEGEEDEDPLKPAGPLKFGKIRNYENTKDKDDG